MLLLHGSCIVSLVLSVSRLHCYCPKACESILQTERALQSVLELDPSLPLTRLLGQELVQGRVQQADGHWLAVHGPEDALKVLRSRQGTSTSDPLLLLLLVLMVLLLVEPV